MQLHEIQMHHREFILAQAAAHGLSGVRVFGSMARGEAGPESDLDLLVKIPPRTSLLTLVRFERLLSERLGISVQTVGDDSLHPLLKDEILHSAIPL